MTSVSAGHVILTPVREGSWGEKLLVKVVATALNGQDSLCAVCGALPLTVSGLTG